MITFEEALNKMRQHVDIIETSQRAAELSDALLRILAQEIISPIDMPPFDRSAMDGFAVGPLIDVEDGKAVYEIVGEIKAGENSSVKLEQGKAVRIYTGAVIPAGTYAVVPIEDILDVNDERKHVTIEVSKVKREQHIRKRGEQFKKGKIILEKGILLNESSLALISSVGITTVKIKEFPRIIILITGDEVVAKRSLSHGQISGKIYDSNGVMLSAYMKKWNIKHKIFWVGDNADSIKNLIKEVAKENDIIVSTGGVSVGEYDYIPTVVKELGFETIFHKVKQKPGKPLLFAVHKNKKVVWWGLPGNPGAVWMCFNLYVLPYLLYSAGYVGNYPHIVEAETISEVFNNSERDWFLGARFTEEGKLEIFYNQRSDMLVPLARSNAIVCVPAKNKLRRGDRVKAFLL